MSEPSTWQPRLVQQPAGAAAPQTSRARVKISKSVVQQLSLTAAAAAAGGASSVLHIQPPAGCSAADASSPVPGEESFTPFGGVGTHPACLAGPVAEFRLEPRSGGHHIELALGVGAL